MLGTDESSVIGDRGMTFVPTVIEDYDNRSICVQYIEGFKLLFSNSAAVLVIVASFFRTFQTVTLGFYLPRYFSVYPD